MIDSILINKFQRQVAVAKLMAICLVMAAASPSAGQDADPRLVAVGRAAFERNCTDCHDADRSLSKQKTGPGWRATVRRMAAMEGADIASGDVTAIAEYLTSRNQPRASGEEQLDGSVPDSMLIESGASYSGTLAPVWRGGNDNLENPNFVPDAWLTVDWQSQGRLRGRATACTSCHSNESGREGFTLEVVEAYVAFDLLGDRPCATRDPRCGVQFASELRAGRMMVPFGGYANAHPGVQKAVTLPLVFNMGQQVERVNSRPPVLPMPYADEGALVHSVMRFRDCVTTLDIYGVNGLQGGGPGVRFTPSRSYTDNNTDLAFGSRATIGNDCLQVGGSWMSGRMQDEGANPLNFHLTGIDSTLRLLDDQIRLHCEYAIRRNDSNFPIRQIAYGTVSELNVLLCEDPNLRFLCRYDTLEHRDFNGSAGIRRFTWGVSSNAFAGSRLMVNHEHWRFSGASPDTDLLAIRWVATF
ncbi:MAG: hypothetical protein P8L85_18755 [Rubripirellula sp.]|nr:hypothetical protein [Rubripirellula sp.]